MEPGTGGGSGRRRRLSDAGRDSLAGLTLGAVLGNDKRSTSQVSRTLLDIIRDEEPNNGAYKNLINHHNNKKSWKSFKDRLRLRRAGAAWTSSDDSPSSDNRMRSYRSSPQLTRRDSTCTPSQTQTISFESLEDANQPPQDSSVVCDPSTQTCSRPQFSRRNSVRGPSLTDQTQSAIEYGDSLVVETVPVSDVPVQNNNRMNMLRRNSSHLPSFSTNSSQQQADPFNDYETAPGIRLSAALAAEREQIQRVVSSSEAAAASAESETEREGEEEEEEEEDGVHNTEEAAAPETEAVAAAQQQPVRMSLMDLLEETDRQMGWVSYMAEDDDEEAEEEVDERGGGGGGGGGAGIEYNCCVCMVRHKGSAFIPCGHTFCRLCSRELWVSRGNCPLCNGYILEILDIF